MSPQNPARRSIYQEIEQERLRQDNLYGPPVPRPAPPRTLHLERHPQRGNRRSQPRLAPGRPPLPPQRTNPVRRRNHRLDRMHRPNPQPGKPATMNNEPRKSIQDKAKPRPARNPARPALPASEPDRRPRDQPCIFMELTSRSSPSPQPRESTTATLKQPSTQGINLPQAQPRQLKSRMHPARGTNIAGINRPATSRPDTPGTGDQPPIHNRPKIRPSRCTAPPEQ